MACYTKLAEQTPSFRVGLDLRKPNKSGAREPESVTANQRQFDSLNERASTIHFSAEDCFCYEK